MSKETQTCVICGETFTGYGHNPHPVKLHGRNCDKCNDFVIHKRIELYRAQGKW